MNDISLEHDPIVAIATATGQGGIGVVRISLGRAGAAAPALMQAIAGRQLTPRQASYVPFHDVESGEVLDRGIALHFPAPHSYTGETVLEFQGHGGPVVMQLLLRSCLVAGRDHGLRLADPGEFTRRAFLNDKLDLAQAEAVADLIEASTEAAARSASRSLAGAFSARIEALVDELIDLRMLVEATLDFPEEEIDFLEAADARGRLVRVIAALREVRDEARQGALLRDGLTVVLAGRPNVGKSSLLNALAGAELAIVTPIAGTTRDRVEQTIQIEGIPLHIVDTAGLRETTDEVERIGIARSWQAIEKADVVVHLLDRTAAMPASGAVHPAGEGGATRVEAPVTAASGSASAADRDIAARLPAGTPVLRVLNKIDLTGSPPARRPLDPADDGAVEEIGLSARTGDGIALLRAALLDATGARSDTQGVFIARERHLQALAAAAVHLDLAAEHAALRAGALDLFAEELRLAQQRLGEITGAFTSDDLLGVIFSRFCIGK